MLNESFKESLLIDLNSARHLLQHLEISGGEILI